MQGFSDRLFMQDLLPKTLWLEPLFWTGLATLSPSTSLLLNRYCTVTTVSCKDFVALFGWSDPERSQSHTDHSMLYRTSGVIFFIDYCTAIRDTKKGW
jgi:hypothetical protein